MAESLKGECFVGLQETPLPIWDENQNEVLSYWNVSGQLVGTGAPSSQVLPPAPRP